MSDVRKINDYISMNGLKNRNKTMMTYSQYPEINDTDPMNGWMRAFASECLCWRVLLLHHSYLDDNFKML